MDDTTLAEIDEAMTASREAVEVARMDPIVIGPEMGRLMQLMAPCRGEDVSVAKVAAWPVFVASLGIPEVVAEAMVWAMLYADYRYQCGVRDGKTSALLGDMTAD
jgi:hypothetical protein